MRNVLLVLIVVGLTLPAAAVEYELVPYGVQDAGNPTKVLDGNSYTDYRTEEELYNDSGTAYYHWSGGIAGFASKFIAPYDLWVDRVKLTCYNSSSRNFYIDILGEDPNTPGKPNRSDSLIDGYETFSEGAHPSDTWVEFDLETNAQLNEDDVFFAMNDDSIEGLDNAPQDNQAPGPPDSAWWYFGGSSWSDLDFFGAMLIRVIVNDDFDAPYVDEQDPADGGAGAPDTEIVFHCKDDDKGVDSDTIDFTAEDETRGDVSGSLDIDDGDPNDVVCTFTPDSDMSEGTVTCTVAGTLADGLGNEMGDDAVWSFVVDATPPTITQEYPTGGRSGGEAPVTRSAVGGGATVVRSTVSEGFARTAGPDTNIGWHIEDNASGCLFEDCVYSVQVGGVDVPVAENITDDGTTDVTVELDPNSDFTPGDVVDVSVQATDIAGNEMDAPYEWSFTVGYANVKDSSLGEIKATYR